MPDGKKTNICVSLVMYGCSSPLGIPSSPLRLHHPDSGIEGKKDALFRPQKEGPGLKYISEHESFSLIGLDESG